MNKQTVKPGIRLVSMLLDHIFMTIVLMVFCAPALILNVINTFNNDLDVEPEAGFGKFAYLFLAGFAIYLCKDSINGRSLAKRILNLQIVENSTGKVASPIRCFVRNIFIILWPVEVIVTLASPTRRIGDFVAGTKVVPYDSMLEKPRPAYGQIAVALGLAYGLMLLLYIPFDALQSKFNTPAVKFVKSSYNEYKSKEIEKIFADSLGQRLSSANVKVYDSVQHLKLKYVTVLLKLKQNELKDDNRRDELEVDAKHLLKTGFPVNSYRGLIKITYKADRYFTSESFPVYSEYSDTTKKAH